MSLTQLDKNAIRQSFDRAASSYGQHDVLQREVESRLLERIEFQRYEPGMVLDLGCGTGLSGALFRRHANRLDGVDLSPAMLDRARERGAEQIHLVNSLGIPAPHVGFGASGVALLDIEIGEGL